MSQDVTIETMILSNLIHNEDYARQVIPFIKRDYFESSVSRIIVDNLLSFYGEYNKPPSQNALLIHIQNNSSNPAPVVQEVEQTIKSLNVVEDNISWLMDNTEKFCKDRAVLKSIIDSFEIIEGKNNDLSRDAIPSMLQDALRVSFNRSVGHDYFDDVKNRYEFYHKKDDKIPFDIDLLNKITRGGLSKKTLNLILAPPKAGKTMFMCHIASAALLKGYNVLYITMEMAEERIAERIDANLLDVDIGELENLNEELFMGRVQRLNKKTQGRLIIKEYPTTSAHAGHFKALMDELKIKKDFIADIVIVDYLNICASSRLKQGGSVNSYSYIKSIAEELRGLAIEYNLPIISATQTNRNSSNATDIEMDSVSECIFVNETVTLRDGSTKKIGDISVGDQISANDDYKTVLLVHHKKMKQCYKITLKSGKTITVSGDHTFPTNRGRISINMGNLQTGDRLNSK
jgi:replicative DNA helicase